MRLLSLLSMALFAAPLGAQELDVPFEKYTLDNGLQVILHEDHSDPVVAVYLYYHVGSGREELGRSGFAHLFEHMLFQGSQNVGDDQHFKLIQEAGGTLNGSTTGDRTNYYEVLPSNQLELALWLESDRMGFLLPSVTQEKLDNQRDVVKNERRQRYDNVPYGRVPEVLAATLYPKGHPYSWTTIGSMEDLSAASLEDVHAFFRQWYGPNNATLAIGGDIDPDQAKALVEKYFASLPRGQEIPTPVAMPAGLKQEKRVVQEDSVQLPQITLTWPTVPRYHPDEAPLDLLMSVLSANRSSVLDRALTIDSETASSVSGRHSAGELAGTLQISMIPTPEHSLDTLELTLYELLEGLAANGVTEEQLQRAKNPMEARMVRRMETVSTRTASLADSNCFSGDPGKFLDELQEFMAVQPADVVRVLNQYILGKPCVIVSVVPEGALDQAASGRAAQQLAAEDALDRKAMPVPGPTPEFRTPAVWQSELSNGVQVACAPSAELPLTTFSLSVPAGKLNETRAKAGLASMTAAMMNEGAGDRGPAEMTEALDSLGASLSIGSDEDEITISLSTLDKHLPAAVELLQSVLLNPRFDAADFERMKRERLVSLETRRDNPQAIAGIAYRRVLYGETVAGDPSSGTPETLEGLTLEDVRNYWKLHVVPAGARLIVVGNHTPESVRGLLSPLTAAWTAPAGNTVPAAFSHAEAPVRDAMQIYLVDKPGAAQSQIRIGHLSLPATHPDYYAVTVMNTILGGSFTSRINLNLREDKGYTYGARSTFGGGLHGSPFTASSGVRTDVTAESVREFMNEITGILDGVTDEELAFAKKSLIQALARQYESTRARAGMVDNISKYEWPEDYVAQRLTQLEALTREDLQRLAREHLSPSKMAILVVGDRSVVEPGLTSLGLGELVHLDTDGRPVTD